MMNEPEFLRMGYHDYLVRRGCPDDVYTQRAYCKKVKEELEDFIHMKFCKTDAVLQRVTEMLAEVNYTRQNLSTFTPYPVDA